MRRGVLLLLVLMVIFSFGACHSGAASTTPQTQATVLPLVSPAPTAAVQSATVSSSAAPTPQGQGAEDPTAATLPIPALATELDKQLLTEADQRRAAILGSKTDITISGKTYYVSNHGDDKNDGRTEAAAWATLDKVKNFKLHTGDAVLFERGGLWRGTVYAQNGVTYSAYGEGEKPKIYASPENGADPAKWSLLSGTGNIWVYNKDMTDCGTLVFNDGERCAIKEIPSFVGGQFVVRAYPQTPFNAAEQLDRNLEFFSEADSPLTDGVPYSVNTMDPRDVTGKLYLRCDEGNPGEVFQSIEFLTCGNTIVPADDTTFDNLCIKYCGSHALYAWGKRITVQNCEFGWIGGSIQFYDSKTGEVTRYGNAIESDGSYDGFTVLNNYIYQVYDSGASNQESDVGHTYQSLAQNITYSGNLIEYCTYGIEIFLNTGKPDVKEHFMKNLLLDNNDILYAGYGWGRQRPDNQVASSIQMWGYANPSENFVIKNNVLFCSQLTLVQCGAEKQWLPVMSGNIYIQSDQYQMAGRWTGVDKLGVEGEQKGYFYASDLSAFIRDTIGDKTAVFEPGAK